MIPRLVYSLLSLCSLAATSTTPRQTDAYTLGYDYLPAFSYSTAFSYSYDDDSTNDDCSCSTDDSAATTATICVLRDTTVCWGNLHRYIERTGTSPFDDIQGGRFGAPALGDLDDDGDLDLVVGEEDGIVSAVLKYYENIGNATSPTYEAVTGAASPFYGIDVGWRRKPALADVDGDGDLDLVVGDDDRALNYYENVGSAASPSYKEVDGDASPFDGIWVREGCGHALGDVDGDGDLDLFVCAFNYYENVGSAASPSYKEVDGDASPFGVIGGSWPALADLDGDGDLDLVVGEYFGALYYYENVGSAASPSYAAVTGSANPFDGIDVGYDIAPALADLDGDGDLDLVVGRTYGALYYYEIVGPAASPNYAALTGTASPFDGIDVGDDSKPALGDLDGDGDLDLVVGEEDGVLNYFENVGSAASPSYVAVTGTANPFDGIDVGDYSAPAFGDVDGDGDLDLVVGCGMPSNSWDDNEKNGVLYYYENIGSAASPTYAAVTGAANPFDGIDVGYDSKPAFADLDDDGDLDLVVGKYDGALYYYENIGSAASPSYEAVNGSANPFDGIDVGYNSAPALADLDGDGDLDLFVGESTGVLNYYMNVGSATAPSYAAVPGTANPFDGVNVGFRGKPAFADLDGDGDLDLVVGEYFGGLNFFANGYCTQGDTACRKKGLCDLTNVVFAEASCQCLGGFDHEVPGEIEQCGECQAGFYGKTCEPCPQGGDEDPNAPRLTDTCGVAGSGRSRGKCDDGVRGDGTCACFGDVFSGSGCTEGTCPAGTVETATFDGYYNNAACTPCAAPFYAPDAGATSCKLADAGFFVDSLGASKQVACDAGKYSGSGAKSCIDCEAGTYQDATGESSCKIAEAGSFVDVAGASRQRPCPAGSFSGSAASECVDCEAGTYVPRSGAVAAVIADAGYVVEVEGASEQTKCPPGSYSGAKASTCALCDPGRFANLEATASCTFALPGTYAWVAGAVAASVCPAGRYSASGASSCDLCPDGQTSDEGSATCAPVDAGLTNAELSTLTFEVGTGLVLSGLDAVRFPDDDAAREAFASAVREIVNAPGGGAVFDVSAEDVHLSAGRRRLDAAGSDAVRFVARAVYELVPGETASEGVMEYTKTFYQDTVRTALLDSIESGDAQRAFDRQDATGTSLASVVVDEALSLAMVRGETAVEIGELFAATDADALVVPCPAGTYSTSGAASCTPCQPGSYTALAGQTDCKFAEPGSFVAAAGASAQAPCPAGTESTSAAVACSPCRVGYYSNLTKQFACQLCPSPTTTLAEGKTYCDACIGDYYWDQRRYVQHAVETPLAESGQPLPCKDCCLECDGACAVDGDDCVSCPAGTTLESMDLKKNYWRVSERAKKIYECTLEKSCDGGWNSSCAPGHKGPLCGSCEAHFFYDAVKNRCEDCGDKIKATGSNIVGTILAALLLLSVVGVVVRRFGLSEVWTNAVNVFREVVKGEAPEDIATEKMEEQDEPVQAKKSVVVDVEESAANEALEEAETAFLSAARRCFDMIDADGSGTLTRMEIAEAVAGNDEVVEFLRTCGDDNLRLLLQPGRIDVALHVLDPSGDGVIDAVEWEAAVQRGPGACLDGQGEAAAKRGAVTKLKIVIATYQIVTSITWTLPQVRFPAAFDRMLKLFSFVNLSLISFAKPECFGSFRYFDKLVFVTLIPPVVLFAIAAAAALRCSCVARERRPGVVDAAWYWSLFALYVLVPSTSSYCLRYFACVDYEGGYGDDISILQIDPMIACTSNSWKRAWMPYAVVAIFVYPVGVPLGFAVALWRLRARVNPPLADEGRDAPASSNVIDSAVAMHRVRLQQMGKLEIRDGDPALAHVEFLFEEYEPRCYLFIVYEILRRIFLTGVLSMFRAGTISQIAIGLLATIVSHRVFTFYEPYIEDDDDLVSEIAQTELVIVFFYALMVFATAHVGQRDAAFASDAFTYILIVLMSSTFAAALAMVVLGQLGKQDRQDLFESLSKSVTSSFGALAAPKAAAGGAAKAPPVEAGAVRTDAVRTDAADVAARTSLGA